MKFTLISSTGHSLGLAMKLGSEGHSVNFLSPTNIGQGLVPSDQSNYFADVDAISIFDDDKFLEDADTLRKSGYRVLGPSKWSSLVNRDPNYAHGLMRSMGWAVVDDSVGINLYITCWFNGRNFISVYSSLVYRRLMSAGRGPDVSFTGVVSVFDQHKVSKVQENILGPLSTILKKSNHRGCVHIHTLINGDDWGVKSISTSFGHPLSIFMFKNSKLPVCDLILKLFNEESLPLAPMDEWSCGIMLSVPPFPYNVETTPVEVKGLEPANLKHIWFTDLSKEDSTYTTGHTDGRVGYIATRGITASEAARRAYRTLRNINIENLQYRDDIGRNSYTLLSNLRQSGWLKYTIYDYNTTQPKESTCLA